MFTPTLALTARNGLPATVAGRKGTRQAISSAMTTTTLSVSSRPAGHSRLSTSEKGTVTTSRTKIDQIRLSVAEPAETVQAAGITKRLA